MADVDLPPYLVSEIENGNVVLLLGAGASREAKNPKGKGPPMARELAKLLAHKFLNDSYENMPLGQVANLAVSEATLAPVQEYVADTLRGLMPTPSHHILTTFRWRAIATTNYDTLVEDAYAANKDAPQKVVPLLDDDQNFDIKLHDRDALPLLKLHGCVSQTRNPACPLILSADSFIDYETKRSRLFKWFAELAADRTVLFLGYSLTDPNIVAILERLTQTLPNRLRYYLMTWGITPIEVRYWEKKKIQAVNATFDDVMQALDTKCKRLFRGMIRPVDSHLDAIRAKLVRPDVALSSMTEAFLDRDADPVSTLKPSVVIPPAQFYKGVPFEWSPIEQNLDVRRKLVDRMLEDYFVDLAAEPGCTLVVVKAHAGAGKTVLLQRLAWDAARSYGRLCLFLKPDGLINSAAVKEIAEATQEPVFLFVDDLVDKRRDIESLFAGTASMHGQVVVVGTARSNEWNQAPDSLTSLAADTDVIDLPYLSLPEIDELLSLLERHHALGSLERENPAERRKRLDQQAGRQLLVALHEATHGKVFQEIIADEFDKITPRKAQEIYLSICLLNQYGAKVRAGIISRMHGVDFEDFQRDFFRPLEQVVFVRTDHTGDHTYEARHPQIAEMVVRSKLVNKEDLYREVSGCLRNLVPGFSSDRVAFNALIRGHAVLEQFPDHTMATSLYDIASRQVGDDPYLFQQMAIYEMNRPNGNLPLAESHARRALQLRPTGRQFKHTLAEVHFRRAVASTQPVERRKWLTESRKACRELSRGGSDEAYPHYTLIKIGTLELERALQEDTADDRLIDEIARDTEQAITSGLQRFPDNAEIRQAEARYAKVLVDDDRFVSALGRAFDLSPRNSMTALRLADCYVRQGQAAEALAILKRALDERPGEQKLHFRYALQLMETKAGNDEILYHLSHSYTPGDSNYEAQFWHARQLFIAGQFPQSKTLFKTLSKAKVAPFLRYQPRAPLPDQYSGLVNQLRASHFMITKDGDGQWVMAPREQVTPEVWHAVSRNARVRFTLAFCLSGTLATDVELL